MMNFGPVGVVGFVGFVGPFGQGLTGLTPLAWGFCHQTFRLVPKMEGFLYPTRMFGGSVFPYINRIHTAYIGEYLYFRYLKFLVTLGMALDLFFFYRVCVCVSSLCVSLGKGKQVCKHLLMFFCLVVMREIHSGNLT